MIPRNTIVTCLTISAVILACVLVLQHTLPGSRAYATTTTRAGDFLAATTVIDGSSDVLWLIDVRSQVLGVFGLTNDGLVQQLATVDLPVLFGTLGMEPQAPLAPFAPQDQQGQQSQQPQQGPFIAPGERQVPGRPGPYTPPSQQFAPGTGPFSPPSQRGAPVRPRVSGPTGAEAEE